MTSIKPQVYKIFLTACVRNFYKIKQLLPVKVHLTEELLAKVFFVGVGVFFFVLLVFWSFYPASKEQEDISLLTDFIKTSVVFSMFPQIRR